LLLFVSSTLAVVADYSSYSSRRRCCSYSAGIARAVLLLSLFQPNGKGLGHHGNKGTRRGDPETAYPRRRILVLPDRRDVPIEPSQQGKTEKVEAIRDRGRAISSASRQRVQRGGQIKGQAKGKTPDKHGQGRKGPRKGCDPHGVPQLQERGPGRQGQQGRHGRDLQFRGREGRVQPRTQRHR